MYDIHIYFILVENHVAKLPVVFHALHPKRKFKLSDFMAIHFGGFQFNINIRDVFDFRIFSSVTLLHIISVIYFDNIRHFGLSVCF